MPRWVRRLAVTILLILVAQSTPMLGLDSCQPEAGNWQTGMYWQYFASSQYHPEAGGNSNEGDVIFAVVGQNTWLGMEEWVLAAIWQWIDGVRRVALFRYLGPHQLPLRWPLVVDALPGASTAASTSDLPLSLALHPFSYSDASVRIVRESATDDELGCSDCEERVTGEGTTEEPEIVELVLGASVDAEVRGTAYKGTLPINYSWSGRELAHVGQALWSPKLNWWIQASGHEELQGRRVLEYSTSLTTWGQLDEAQLQELLRSVLLEMDASGNGPVADCLRVQLAALGVELE